MLVIAVLDFISIWINYIDRNSLVLFCNIYIKKDKIGGKKEGKLEIIGVFVVGNFCFYKVIFGNLFLNYNL